NQNQALFALLGTMYGGDGRVNFALPDLRGRTPVEAGQGQGLADRGLGEQFGVETVTLTVAQLAPHFHIAAPPIPGDADGNANTVPDGSVNGTPVGITASATDPEGDPLTYALTADSSNGGFQINPATGVVSVLDPNKVDFESSGA